MGNAIFKNASLDCKVTRSNAQNMNKEKSEKLFRTYLENQERYKKLLSFGQTFLTSYVSYLEDYGLINVSTHNLFEIEYLVNGAEVRTSLEVDSKVQYGYVTSRILFRDYENKVESARDVSRTRFSESLQDDKVFEHFIGILYSLGKFDMIFKFK